jgi:bacillithiol biosynthesis cysteine-adding enzyme BshC
MKVDKELTKLISTIAGQLQNLPFGHNLVSLLQNAYKEGISIQQATLTLVNELFKTFGLLILIPDNANLKRSFKDVVKKELTEQFSKPLVDKTIGNLPKSYKAQASGRELNLFYLTEDKRERIEKVGEKYIVATERIEWTEEQILQRLEEHPECFSANVILRGVFQEMVLPNIAFVGGGGEIAYWLELKNIFEACKVPYPLLVLRNSFLLINPDQQRLADKLSFDLETLFKPTTELTSELVKRESNMQLQLTGEKEELNRLYSHLKVVSSKVDTTLSEHVEALHAKALDKVIALEKKLLKAEKRKFQAQQRQVEKLKAVLFPGNNLQERVENFCAFYASYGDEWLNQLYNASLTLEQKFCIVSSKPPGKRQS